jgi:ABC-type Fe3+ transport system permease subunit
MTKKTVKRVFLSSTADFFNGMSTAWAFASYDAIFHKAWIDLLTALALAILALTLSIGIKMKNYDKHT